MSDDSLKEVFNRFASFGSDSKETMDGTHFAKLCKDADLGMSTTDIDLAFAKVVGNSGQSVTFEGFQKLVEALAERKGCGKEEVVNKMSSAEPSNTGTKAEPNKFHDDKELYTGVHKYALASS